MTEPRAMFGNATRPRAMSPRTPASARTARPAMAWRHSVTTSRDQLTHAVLPGGHTAQCGVVVSVLGAPWPEPGAGTPLSRCSICAQAVQGWWKGGGHDAR